ncbi:MAG TPA: response regulator, partial [Terriglobales bacterium]|nr:response regulator [Terriglobales bacterium]
MAAMPTVLFIDDSATMREVIKIAFRRENLNVVATHDAAKALGEIEQTRPDIVITDVIMPEKDGYEVCQFIKSHPELAKTPVILMSGVVNRAVAERAFSAKADELLRKPFQPQDLIARVRHLLGLNRTPAALAGPTETAAALSAIFSSAPTPATVMPKAAATPAAPAPVVSPIASGNEYPGMWPEVDLAPKQAAVAPSPAPAPAPVARAANGNGSGSEMTKMRVEVLRLEGLVKKLQAELQAERDYSRNLETQMKTLQQEC